MNCETITLLERLKKAYEYCESMEKFYTRPDFSMVWVAKEWRFDSFSGIKNKFYKSAKDKIGRKIFKKSIESFKTGVE